MWSPGRSTARSAQSLAAIPELKARAWAPPSALHPTLGVDTPLIFDLIDTWNGLSIGGCTYHVSHPGGRNYDTLPVNSNEAEARRINRFWGHGFTQGLLTPPPAFNALRKFYEHDQVPQPMEPPVEEANFEYPHTLDMRKKYTRL